MICKKCKRAAATNRVRIDTLLELGEDHPHYGDESYIVKHPKNCGCPCMHRSGPWEKLFSVERPNA